MSRAERYLLVYDADCGPCQKFRRAVARLDQYDRLEYMSLVEADALGLLDSIAPNRRHRSFHLILPGGKVSSGSAAIPSLVGLLPLGGFVSALMRKAPKGETVVNFVYTTFSRLHDNGSCSYTKSRSSLCYTKRKQQGENSEQRRETVLKDLFDYAVLLHRKSILITQKI